MVCDWNAPNLIKPTGVSGSHMRGFNNTGVHPVVSADREITDADIQDVIKNAKAINLPSDHSVVHVIRQHFRVDGQDGVLTGWR